MYESNGPYRRRGNLLDEVGEGLATDKIDKFGDKREVEIDTEELCAVRLRFAAPGRHSCSYTVLIEEHFHLISHGRW